MNNKKKVIIRTVAYLFIIALMGFILWYIFKDSIGDIACQLSNTKPWMLFLMILLGNMYYVIDATIYMLIFKREKYYMNFGRQMILAYMSIFYNVTTFGAGIKPGQTLYLNRKGMDAGTAFGITTMPYVFHKLIIVAYALVMLLFNNRFVVKNFSSTFGYIYIGVGLNLVIVVFLFLLCASEKFHKLVYKLLDKILKKEKAVPIREKIKYQVNKLREGTLKIIKTPSLWLKMSVLNIMKMSCWYVIPVIAIYAAGGSLGNVTVSQALTVTALMQLLMGVIPTSGGVGSLEVVFSLLFAVVFGKIMAGSSMVLYRVSTYYVPFLISIITMVMSGYDMKHDKIKIYK